MPSGITGPGVDAGSGGPSSIAAVSVDVYVADRTQPGFAKLKAETEAAAVGAGVQGEKAGAKFGGGLAQGLRSAGREFHHILHGLITAPLVAFGAFELGQKIKQTIIDAFKSGAEVGAEELAKIPIGVGAKGAAQSLEGVQKLVADLNDELAYAEKFPLAIGRNFQANFVSVKQIRAELEYANKAAESFSNQLKAANTTEKKLAEDAAKYAHTWDDLTERIKEAQKELDDTAEQQRHMGDEMVERYEEANYQAEKLLKAEERRRDIREHAQAAGSIDNLDVNITRLRQLAEIGMRQRYPADPGAGEY